VYTQAELKRARNSGCGPGAAGGAAGGGDEEGAGAAAACAGAASSSAGPWRLLLLLLLLLLCCAGAAGGESSVKPSPLSVEASGPWVPGTVLQCRGSCCCCCCCCCSCSCSCSWSAAACSVSAAAAPAPAASSCPAPGPCCCWPWPGCPLGLARLWHTQCTCLCRPALIASSAGCSRSSASCRSPACAPGAAATRRVPWVSQALFQMPMRSRAAAGPTRSLDGVGCKQRCSASARAAPQPAASSRRPPTRPQAAPHLQRLVQAARVAQRALVRQQRLAAGKGRQAARHLHQRASRSTDHQQPAASGQLRPQPLRSARDPAHTTSGEHVAPALAGAASAGRLLLPLLPPPTW
jgi:hypothetical protein